MVSDDIFIFISGGQEYFACFDFRMRRNIWDAEIAVIANLLRCVMSVTTGRSSRSGCQSELDRRYVADVEIGLNML